MKYTLIYILLALTFCVGCKKTWDDHYGYEDDPRIAEASLTAWEVLNSMPDRYSRFVTLIRRAGYDKALNSNRMLTVWAPENKYITDKVMAYDSLSPDVIRFVTNHLNSLPLFKTKIVGREKINTLAGKSLVLYQDYRDLKIYIDGQNITVFDLACTNGVVHEIAGVLTPLQNLSEYLVEAGDEYQLFRDSITGRNDTLFRADLSFPIGVNDVGQTVYDSVFDIENTLLLGLALHDEEQISTLCLPSNAVIHDAFVVIKDYMKEINREFTAVDSAKCFEWIMKASILDGKVDDYAFAPSYMSAYDAEIRPSWQLVRSDYKECSNGYVYLFETLYIPRSIFMYNAESNLLNFLDIDDKVNSALKLWSYTGKEFVKFDDNGGRVPFLTVGGAVGDYLEFKPIRLNIYSEPEIIKLMPGKYSVSGQFFGYGNASRTKLTINGEVQKWYKDGTTTFPTNGTANFEYNTFPIMVDTLHIKPQAGYSVPIIRLEALDANPIRVQRMKFQAVGKDNY